MANVVLEFQAKIEDALGKIDKLSGGIVKFEDANKDAAGALGVFGVKLDGLNSPLTTTAEILKQSVTAAANWGDEMGDLAQLTGTNAQQASKMAATFELVGVSTGSIEQAMKTMVKNGMTPTIENFKTLADRYKAIQDPAERTEFLFKQFGRAGVDMAEIMGRDSTELDKLAAAAMRSGKVIGDDAAGAAEEFNTNLAILQQRAEGVQIAIGNAVIPTLNAAATSFDQLVTIASVLNTNYREWLGITDANTAQMERLKAAGIDPATESTKTLTVSVSEATAASKDMADSQDLVTAAAERQRIAHENDINAADRLKASFGELTNQMIFNQAAASLDADGQLELARQLGLVNEKTYGAISSAQDLKAKYDTNHDGAVSAAEGAAEYIAQLSKLKDTIDSIHDKVVTVQVVTQGDFGQVITGGDGGNQLTTRRAGGGPVTAGRPYIVGEEGQELFIPSQNGTIIPHNQTTNYNLSVNTTQSLGGVSSDFALMRAVGSV